MKVLCDNVLPNWNGRAVPDFFKIGKLDRANSFLDFGWLRLGSFFLAVVVEQPVLISIDAEHFIDAADCKRPVNSAVGVFAIPQDDSQCTQGPKPPIDQARRTGPPRVTLMINCLQLRRAGSAAAPG